MSRSPRPVQHARVVPPVRAWLCALAVNSLLGVNVASAAPASAAVSSVPLDVALRYEASRACPEREAFLELVRVRAPHVRLQELGPAQSLEVVVVLSEQPRGAAGEARILLDGRVRDTREFLGANCLEVARAAAISVSFVLETWSVEAPSSEPGGRPSSEPGREPSSEARQDAPPELKPDEQSEAAQSPLVSSRSQDAVSDAAAPPALRFDVGLAPVAASLLDQPWLLGAGLSLGARSAREPRPSVRLSALAAVSGQGESAASSYRWVVAEALLCAFRLGDEWSLSPCAHGLVGVLHAEGSGIDFPVDVAVPWFAVGPSLKGTVSIGTSTRLVASVSASVPLAQRSFVFERPYRVVTQTLSVGWLVSAGVEHDIGGS